MKKKRARKIGEILAYSIMMLLIAIAYTPLGDLKPAELWECLQALLN